jgi:sugar phosphate isomerase/epimerase
MHLVLDDHAVCGSVTNAMMKTHRPASVINEQNNQAQRHAHAQGTGRREFLRMSGALAVCLGFGSRMSAFAADAGPGQPNAAKLGWGVSVQQWTYRRFPLFEALDKVAAVGLRHIEIRTILKLDAKRPDMKADENMPADARKELKARLADRGLSLPSVYADFNGKPDQAKRLFEFWKDFGTEVIVTEPTAGPVDLLDTLCEEYKMRVGVHNHQKGQSEYWKPDTVLELCANRSPRFGAACDGGQWARSGLDPVECLRKLQGRIITFHLKDVLKKGQLNSRNTVIGEGEADCARTLKELRRLGYKGLITIDFEHDTPTLQEDMARNIAFVEDQARQLLNG